MYQVDAAQLSFPGGNEPDFRTRELSSGKVDLRTLADLFQSAEGTFRTIVLYIYHLRWRIVFFVIALLPMALLLKLLQMGENQNCAAAKDA